MFEQTLFLNNFTAQISSNDSQIQDSLEKYLDFSVKTETKSDLVLRVDFVVHPGRDNPKDVQLHYENKCDPKQLRLTNKLSLPLIEVENDFKKGRITCHIYSYMDSYLHKEQMFNLALKKAFHLHLSRRDQFFIHASGVYKKDKGILFCGSSGSGKSTLALHLAQRGYHFLTDDGSFFQWNDNSVCMHPFPTMIGVEEYILKLYPQYRDSVIPDYLYGEKMRLAYGKVSEATLPKGLRGKMIVFPHYRRDCQPSIRRLSVFDTYHLLVQEHREFISINSYNRESYKNNQLAFMSLAQQWEGYELIYDQDADTACRMIVDKFNEAMIKGKQIEKMVR